MSNTNKIIYLVGFMGTGKSTVGRLLADKLNYEFVDLDDYIVDFSQMTIKEIFKEKGEKSFRAIETQCLRDLSGRENLVVSCGGGVPLSLENREILNQSGKVIWLDADGDEIVRRVTLNNNRPLVNGKSPAEIKQLQLDREPIYNSLGAIKIDTTNLEPSVIASTIVDQLYIA